jgi:uncharacterized lipoprotein YddW (UPF0748 family)
MQKQRFPLLILILFLNTNLFSESNPPKRELRGAWVATVVNLDWPSSPYYSPEKQRSELIAILDELHRMGINTVIFQIRPECDAFYQSSLEPWSYYLTGSQGTAPTPFYDPLEFAIAEVHKRGMELHAWFNPYRAVRQVGAYPIDQNHVSIKHPDWIIQIGDFKFLDPGFPMVREFVTSVVMDVVTRYDIDGVHFDDYFYPYPPNQITSQDDQTFDNYSRGFTNRGDWRRDNVNLLVKMVYEGIQSHKPFVKFGISPFGIWKNGVPAGIVGLDAYNTIYADALAWLNQQTVDYLTPQLYWPHGGGQDYGKLLPWWAERMNGRHLYPGQAAYKISSWSNSEMPNQIRLNRNTENVYGSIYFRAYSLQSNPRGFADSLTTDFYRFPAISPIMAWKDSIPPNDPWNLKYESLYTRGPAGLKWNIPTLAADGDSAFRYVVYRFDKDNIQITDLEDPARISSITGIPRSSPEIPPNIGGPYYYLVTALDRNSNESDMSNMIAVYPPEEPVLVSPVNGEQGLPSEAVLTWHHLTTAASYQVQVSMDSTFTREMNWDETGISDTFKLVIGLAGQQRYYWRVRASNAGGTGDFSDHFAFTTGFPVAPLLVYPNNNTSEIPIDPIFTWNAVVSATSYQLQVARSINFAPTSMVFDSSGIVDTTYSGVVLENNRLFFWRVNATNSIDTGNWSETFKFKTVPSTDVAVYHELPNDYKLYPNYPNPFNMTTIISFDIPEQSHVTLKIYDGLGREIATVVDDMLERGHHEVLFGGRYLPSGIYLYRLKGAGTILTGKMLMLK